MRPGTPPRRPRPGRGHERRTERGAVTAEAALVLPLLALVTVGLAWMIGVGVAQGRAQDAAREAARVVARGEAPATGQALARQVAPSGATVAVHRGAGQVEVVVRAPVRGPGGLFAFLNDVSVTARSVAALEAGAAGATP